MRSDQSGVSVVIAYFRNTATLRDQLDALVAQSEAPVFEVVIADNEGSSEVGMIVADYAEKLDVRVVPANEVRGQCHARNVAVNHARYDYIAMCDADDVVGPKWVRALFDTVHADDVIATGVLRLDEINPEKAWRVFLGVGSDVPVNRPVDQTPYTYLDYLPFAYGCNIGIRAATYKRLGGMDESMLGGSEDAEFSWRAQEAGLTIQVCRDAVVHYRLRSTVDEIFRQQYRYQRAQLGLWNRSRHDGRPVRGMSLRWAVVESARLPLHWARVRKASEESQYVAAARAGSVLGNLVGQLTTRGPWHR